MTGWLRPWFLALAAGWGVLLLVLALAAYGDDPTVPSEQDIATARVTADRAAVEVAVAAGQQAAVKVSRFQLVETCDISLVRSGVDYRRRVELFTEPGAEVALLKRIAARLPESYQASYASTGGAPWGALDQGDSNQPDGPRLAARADKFVQVQGSWGGARTGVVQVEIRTGCRPAGDPVAHIQPRLRPAEQDQLDAVFELAGITPDQGAAPSVEAIDCGAGQLRSFQMRVDAVPDRPLGDVVALASPDVHVLIGDRRLLAYRQGEWSVLAKADDHATTVHVTRSDC